MFWEYREIIVRKFIIYIRLIKKKFSIKQNGSSTFEKVIQIVCDRKDGWLARILTNDDVQVHTIIKVRNWEILFFGPSYSRSKCEWVVNEIDIDGILCEKYARNCT